MRKKLKKGISIILIIILIILLLFFLNVNVISINFVEYKLNDIDEVTWSTLNEKKSDFKYLLPIDGDLNSYKSIIVTFLLKNNSPRKNIFWLDYEIKLPKDNNTVVAYSLPVTKFREIPSDNEIRYSINLIMRDSGNINDSIKKIKFSFKSFFKESFLFGYNYSTLKIDNRN